MKKGFLLIVLTVVGFTVMAQQRAHYSQYMINKYVLNPAVAGTQDNYVDFKAGIRTQWVGLADAPNTYYFTANMPIGKPMVQPGHHYRGEDHNWHGVGMQAYSDATGPTKRSGGYGSYAYNLGINKYIRVSLGAFVGVQQFTINSSVLKPDPQSPDGFGSDQILGGDINDIVPDIGVGAWLYSRDFYIGVSAFQLLRNELDLTSTSLSRLMNHYFVTAGINLPVSEEFQVIPSFIVKVVTPAPISVDLDCRIKHISGFWGGVSYRSGDSFTAVFGYQLELGNRGENGVLDFSYAFDLTTSALRNYNVGSHEVVVGYRLPLHGHIICASKFWH